MLKELIEKLIKDEKDKDKENKPLHVNDNPVIVKDEKED